MTIKTEDHTGYSQLSLDDAMANVLEKVGKHRQVKIIETRSSTQQDEQSEYQVTVTIQVE